jgi:nucleotide-binding universal stress UspA family protein
LQRQADEEADGLVREAAEQARADVSVTTRVRHGHAGEEIVRQVEEGGPISLCSVRVVAGAWPRTCSVASAPPSTTTCAFRSS